MGLLETLSSLLVPDLTVRSRARRAEELWARTGQVRSAVRVVSGQEDGLSGEWQRTLVGVSYGRLAVDERSIDVEELATVTRPATGPEKRRIAPDAVVVQVTTSNGAVLDWVVAAAMLPHVRSRMAR